MERIQNHIHTILFRQCGSLLTARARIAADARILSFGCSIGDEVATLRSLFPVARLSACEIHPPALAQARRRVGHLADVFHSTAEAILERGPFDLIIASAVLCVNPPKDIAHLFPFSKFESAIAVLDAALSSGGIMVITNASYRFRDTQVSRGYRSIRSDVSTTAGWVDVFAPDGSTFLVAAANPYLPAYRKGVAFQVDEDEDLIDCVFEKSQAVEPITLTLAKHPEFEPAGKYVRCSADGFEAPPGDLIVVRDEVEFGTDRTSGRPVAFHQISWPSLVSETVYKRPGYWSFG